MFELTENLAHVGSVIAAVEIWGGGGQSRALILSETIKQLGCAIHDCPVRIVAPVFIR